MYVEPEGRGGNSARLSTLAKKAKGGAPDVMNPKLQDTNNIISKEEVNGEN